MQALVIFSGGIDSTTALYWAQNQGYKLHLRVPLEHTWSCYEVFDVPSEKCKGCQERNHAFAN